MAKPSDQSMKQLRRLGRYLQGRRRLIFRFDFQGPSQLEAYSGTDWGGCLRTRKSTSGGCLMLGNHTLKSSSATQPSVSLRSGEAEFYCVVRASGIALGQQSLFRDLGYDMAVRVWTDSSAAIGICQRHGLGRLRHIDTQALWMQQKVKDKLIELRKVRGEVNPADMFTNFLLSKERLDSLVNLFNCEFRDGRPEAAPLLRKADDDDPDDQTNHLTHVHQREVLAAHHSHEFDDVPEAGWHDVKVLPHMNSTSDVNKLFPMAEAGTDIEDLPEYTGDHELDAELDCLEGQPRAVASCRGS